MQFNYIFHQVLYLFKIIFNFIVTFFIKNCLIVMNVLILR